MYLHFESTLQHFHRAGNQYMKSTTQTPGYTHSHSLTFLPSIIHSLERAPAYNPTSCSLVTSRIFQLHQRLGTTRLYPPRSLEFSMGYKHVIPDGFRNFQLRSRSRSGQARPLTGHATAKLTLDLSCCRGCTSAANSITHQATPTSCGFWQCHPYFPLQFWLCIGVINYCVLILWKDNAQDNPSKKQSI